MEFGSTNSIAGDFKKAERSNKIHESLIELEFNYRIIIVLRHYLELSYAEISELIDLPEKIVKSRLFSARKMLKDIFIKKRVLQYE